MFVERVISHRILRTEGGFVQQTLSSRYALLQFFPIIQHVGTLKGLHLTQITELYAARELYADAVQGDISFGCGSFRTMENGQAACCSRGLAKRDAWLRLKAWAL
jgi:hypothetical protein